MLKNDRRNVKKRTKSAKCLAMNLKEPKFAGVCAVTLAKSNAKNAISNQIYK